MARPRSNSPDDSMWASRAEEMAAFDRLPIAIRQILMQTRVQWSALSIERLMHRSRIPAETIVQRLLVADRNT